MKPASDNILFFDTEFSSLNPYIGELLSVGIVNLEGQEFYIELAHSGKVSQWVQQNILPTLTDHKYSRKVAASKIKDFVGDNEPYMVAFVNTFDAIYTYKLFDSATQPFHWIPIDFASMLFAHGMDPEELVNNRDAFCIRLGIDAAKYQHHNALDDAKLLREIYLALTQTT